MIRKHWFVERMNDPIKKILDDLEYLNFRRNLLITFTPDFKICVHKSCVESFENVNFFDQVGKDHHYILVENKEETQKLGAAGFLCGCPKVLEEPQCKARFQNWT